MQNNWKCLLLILLAASSIVAVSATVTSYHAFGPYEDYIVGRVIGGNANYIHLYADASTNDMIDCGNSPGTAACTFNAGVLEQNSQAVTLAGANGISAGTVILAGGSGSHAFATAYTNAPVCTASDQTSAAAVKVTSSITSVTLSGTSTDTISWVCAPSVN